MIARITLTIFAVASPSGMLTIQQNHSKLQGGITDELMGWYDGFPAKASECIECGDYEHDA